MPLPWPAMMSRALVILLLTVACGPRPAAAPRPTSTPAPPTAIPTPQLPTPTPLPKPPTSTPQPDYRGMRTRLLTPLGAMIVAIRGNDRTQAAAHLADFNKVADDVLPAIGNDMSKPANALHSAIVNVRSHPGDLAALEQDRRNLLADIP